MFGNDGILQLDYGTPPYSEALMSITVQHLLEQTDGWDNSLPDDCLEKVDQKEFIDCVVDAASEDVNFSPGTKWNVSTFGYVLLGRIIEKLARYKDPLMNYEKYVKKNVLTPCNSTELYIGKFVEVLAGRLRLQDPERQRISNDTRGLHINRLIGLSQSFSLIGLGFGHLIFWTKYLAQIWPKPEFFLLMLKTFYFSCTQGLCNHFGTVNQCSV